MIAAVDAAEVALGENMKVSINLNLNRQQIPENDITYLVRDVLHLCACVFVQRHKHLCCFLHV